MYKIGVLSDTHSFLDQRIISFFNDCQEIWHAGDIGNLELEKHFDKTKIIRAVHGNIDDYKIRATYSKHLTFNTNGLSVIMTHISGFSGKYSPEVIQLINNNKPDILITGHSHILKVKYDNKFKLLHINPGAAGNYGFHIYKTAIRFDIINYKPANLEVLELERGLKRNESSEK